MLKKITSLLLTALLVSSLSLTAFAQADVSPNTPKPPSTTTTATTATVPKDVKPVKSYTAEVGKTYKLPDTVKTTGDTYASSNSKVLTVDKTTGKFTTVANGVAYIVVTNGTSKSYIKLTVGTGVASTTTTTASPNVTQNADGSTSITIRVNDGSSTGSTTGTTNGTASNNTSNSFTASSTKTTKQEAERAVQYIRTCAEEQGMTWSVSAKSGGFMPSLEPHSYDFVEYVPAMISQLIDVDCSTVYAEVEADPYNSGSYVVVVYR